LRKFLQILGVLFIVLFVSGIALAGVAFYRLHKAEVQGKAYLDAAFPAIAANWDQQQLLSRAGPDLMPGITPDEEANLFFQLSLLGPMQQYEGSTADHVESGASVKTGARTYVYCTTKARFRSGTVVFHIMLLRSGGVWTIDGFHVNPA
jgi:hypothetical protein